MFLSLMLTLATRYVRESIFLDCPVHDADGVLVDEAAIWTIELSGKLTALYSNPDGSTVVINFAYNTVTNIIVLVDNVGDLCSQNSGWKQVVWLSIDTFFVSA